MANFFDQFDQAPAKEAKVTGNFFDQFDAKPEPRPEDQSVFRQVADVPLQLGKGVVSGVRMIADAFGAGSETSKVLKGGEDYLAGLMSAQSKQDSKEIARIMKEAEDKGVLDQVVAGIKALSVAPVDTLVNAFGTSAPAIIGSLAAIPAGAFAVGAVGAGIGATMGAGTIKGGIYDAVKEELSKTDMPKDQIEARAKLAQDYDGKNLDMILTGAAIGTLGATTGIEPALAKTFSKNIIQKTAKEKAAEETRNIAKQGIKKYATKEGLTEFGTEFTQAGQEQLAQNLALQREGIDTPLMRGVISNAVLEGLAGLGMGAGVGVNTVYKAKQEVARINQETKNIVKQDLESKGIDATEEQLDEIVEKVNKVREEKEPDVSGNNIGAVAGAGDQKNDESSTLDEQEATRIKDIEDQRNAIESAYQEHNAPNETPAGNTTKAGATEETLVDPDFGSLDQMIKLRDHWNAKLASYLDTNNLKEYDALQPRLVDLNNRIDALNGKKSTPEEFESLESKTFEEVKAIKEKYDAKLSSLLSKNANKPRLGTKKREEYDKIINYLTDVYDLLHELASKKVAEEENIEPTPIETTEAVESTPIETTPANTATEAVTTAETPARIKTEEEIKEDKVRKANGIPHLETLPKELQENKSVQRYHSLFDEWLAASSLGDIQGQHEILTKMHDVRFDLPEGHPSAYVFEKSTSKGKGKGKKEKSSDVNGPVLAENDYAKQVFSDPSPEEAAKIQAGVEGKTTYEVAVWLAQNSPDPDYKYIASRVADRIAEMEKLGKKFTFKVVHYGDSGLPSGFSNPSVRGVTTYVPKGVEGTEIYVKGADVTGSIGTSYEVILHELIHAVTTSAMTLGNFRASVGTDLFKTVSAMFDVTSAIIKHINTRAKADISQLTEFEQSILAGANALQNPKEVVAWTLTNRDMQAYLETIPYKNTNTDIWSALVTAIRNFLKLPIKYDTALSEVLHLSDKLLSSDLKDLGRIAGETQTNLASDIDSPKLAEGSDVLFAPVHPVVDEAIRNGDLRGALQAVAKTGGTYLSNLANRLLSLGANVVVGYDLQTTLIPKYLETVKAQKDRVLNLIEILYPDIYDAHFNESLMLDPLTQLQKSFNKLKYGEFDIDIKGFEQDVNDVVKVYDAAFDANKAPGFFYDNSISFNSANKNKYGGGVVTMQTFMHEVTHGYTHWAINNPDLLDEKQKKALDNLNKLYEYAKAHTKNPELYGYTTLHEFVAEAFSKVSFQKELRAMKAGPETEVKQSAWSKFIHTVYRMLNKPSKNGEVWGIDNVLFHTLANTDILFSAKQGQDTSGINSPLMAQDKFSVTNGKIRTNTKETGFINSLIGNRQKFSSLNKNNLSSFFSTLNDQTRRYLLGGLTLDQLTDIAGDNLPQFKEYVRAIDAMLDTRNKILLEGEESLKNWSHLLESNPKKAEELGTAMIEATFAKLDPDPTTKGYDVTKFKHTKQGQRALEAWKKLELGKDGDKAVAIYRDVRKFYETRMEEYIKIELDRLVERNQINNVPPEKIKELKDAREETLRKDIIKPYFPIKRFGDYWIQVGKGKDKVFMQFENAGARNIALQEAYDELLKKGHTKEQILGNGQSEKGMLDYGNQFKTEMSGKLADFSQLTKLHDLINATTVEVQSSSAVDKAESLRAKLNENMDQLYLELMPSESIKKMFIHRKNIAGPSQDMLRAFAVSRQRVAYQRSRFQHLPTLFTILKAAEIRLNSMPFDERTKWRDYVRELELNLKTAVLEPPKQSKLTTWLTQFGFLQYLTAPASALVNAMAIPGIYIPAAAPKYGAGNVATSLAKYNRMLGGTGYTDKRTGKLEFLSLARANLSGLNFAGTEKNKVELPSGKTLADVYQSGVSRNVIDTTLSHDAAAIGEQPSDEYTGRWQKVMYYASLPFHAAEKYNRETTFMASFDMAYRKYIDKGYTKEKAYEAALDDARDLVQSTMFNYNTINKPRYFRGDFRNVILQFKQYPQHMTVLMFRTFQQGWRSGMDAEMAKYKEQIAKSPADIQPKLIADKEAELKQMAKEAKEQFMGMMGMTFLFSGMSGLPLFFIFEAVANAFQAVFGDDDEFFDVDNWFKNWCNRTFGGFVGDSISRGLLSQATGLNFADRMSVNLNDMWFPDVKKSNDEVQYMQNVMTNLLGPTAGAFLNYGEALKRYNDGHTERAVEAIMPAAIKNVMVGTRYLVEGKALTLKGAELDSNVLPGEALAQMLGFTPEKITQKQKATIEAKGVEQAILNRHTDLVNAFFMAVDSSDADMLERVVEKIGKFNSTNPGNAISPDALYDSVIKRYENRALANITGGMSINKKLVPQLQNMLDYSK